MEKTRTKTTLAGLYSYSAVAIVGLIAMLATSAAWNINKEQSQTLILATKEAKTIFNKDVALRFWATEHGGVYVPVTSRTPPSPGLKHIADRDITTPSGKQLTLMNPAYMRRQIMEGYEKRYGGKGHITSLKRLNPINTPDDWEHKALRNFERGINEVIEVTDISGEPHLRYMQVLKTGKGCLKCHQGQGYQVGDVRGGVGVSVPLNAYYEIEQDAVWRFIIYHLLIGILGIVAIVGLTFHRKKGFEYQVQKEDLILQANANLEKGVKERTGQLEEANRRLNDKFHEHELAKKALVNSEERFKSLVNTMNSGVAIYEVINEGLSGSDYLIVDFNTFALDHEGLTLDAVKGRSLKDIRPNIDAYGLIDAFRKVWTTGKPEYFPATQYVDDNFSHYYENRVFKLPGGEIVAIFDDVTSQKSSEIIAFQAAREWQTTFDAANDAIWIMDTEQIIKRCNSAACQMFGLSFQEMVGKRCWEVIHGTTEPISDCPAVRASNSLIRETMELNVDGRWMSITVDPMLDDKGRFEGVVHFAVDITQRKVSELKIAKELEEKRILLHEIHHRVKNNIQIVSSLLELQLTRVEDEEVRKILRESQSRVHAMSIVHELLHDSENLSEIDLDTYIHKIAATILSTYAADSDRIKLNIKVDKTPISINQASPVGLIINELISNSLKYAFPGNATGEISIQLKKAGAGLELTVADDGIGFPEDLDWRLTESLGMKLIRSLAEVQLDGSIEAEESDGTAFTIKFNPEGQ